MKEWIEIENCRWSKDLSDNKKLIVKALFHLDLITIFENVYIDGIKYSSKCVFGSESNYDANEFMLNKYGIEVEFGY